MSKKATVTRTYGPIHFEDLDPHRFEDLIRELIYDFKDWRSIEATGRSGNDEGFDIRAYEKRTSEQSADDDQEADGESVVQPMEGNLWMVQGKREKELGPKRVESIVSAVDESDPPYGYILAASANFSKDSYDIFRKVLRQKGVMEFYLWGKAELEDMLHLPKNDRILFTFFGVSLVTRRRSRTTEIRAAVAIKNKLIRTLDDSLHTPRPILLRDLDDTHYPYKDKYPDFEEKPRWLEADAVNFHPIGLEVLIRTRYAYLDRDKKEYDFTRAADAANRHSRSDDDRRRSHEQRDLVTDVFDFFPRSRQALLCTYGLIRFADLAIVDDQGDVQNKCPHLYVDFVNGPFWGTRKYFKVGDEHIPLTDDYLKVSVFPEVFQKTILVKPTTDKTIELDAVTLKDIKEYRSVDVLCDTSGKYAHLNQRDVLAVSGADAGTYLQVTCKIVTSFGEYIRGARFLRTLQVIEQQLGRRPTDAETVTIYEIKRIHMQDSEWLG